jgi:hypothetical protein
MNAETDRAVKVRFEVASESVQGSCVRDPIAQPSGPGVV